MSIIQNRRGFTLIELMISITIVTIMSGAVFFAANSALDSWAYCRDQLSIQKALAETVDQIISGTVTSYGLKDSLEISQAGRDSIEFIAPWIDDTHSASNKDFVYKLNRKLKPGAPVPIAEIKLAESKKWRIVPITVLQNESLENTQVKLNLSVPEGSDLRFVYHPDWKEEPDTVKRIFYDKVNQEVMMDTGGTVQSISKNLFGVEITSIQFLYYTSNNELITKDQWVDEGDLQIITGVELTVEAKLNQEKRKLVRFVNLRNSPLRTGYLTLRPNMKLQIPNSKDIRTLLVTNLTGISSGGILQLEALPKNGNSWRATIEFEKLGSAKPVVKRITIDYPTGQSVYSEYPKMSADLGINLMLIGSDGLYDYDNDEDVDDIVNLEGDIILYVNEMTIKGAGLFVKP